MKFLRNTILVSIAFGFLIACIAPPTPLRTPKPEPAVRTNEEVKALEAKVKKLQDKVDRNAKTSDSRRKTKSECDGDRGCERICDDIYSSSRDRRDCQDLSVAVVERLQEVYEALEDGDSNDLEGIDYTDLDVLVGISIDPLEDVIHDYKSREARDVAAWLAEEPDVVRIFQKEEEDYGLFKDLFKEIDTDILEALSKNNITSGDSFMELIINANNEVALEKWVHSYLQDDDKECGSAEEEEFCVLSKYCQMALNDDAQDDLANIEYFEDFIEDLIEDANNGNIEVPVEDNDKLGVNKVKCPVTREYIVNDACEGGTDTQKLAEFFGTANSSTICSKTKADFNKSTRVECDSIGDTWDDIDDGDARDWGDEICT